MESQAFPSFIRSITPKDYGIPGLEVHYAHTPQGTMWWVRADREVEFPVHEHARQWTVVVAGSCTLTINGESHTYHQGETYIIPGHTPHQITLHAGYAEVDYVDDPHDGD